MSEQAQESMYTALTPSQLMPALERCAKAKLVPIVRSSPAMGKSDITRAFAKDYSLMLLDFRLGQADITDLNGLPRFNEEGFAEFVPFDSFPLATTKIPAGYNGWLLFFDEITVAQKQIQAAAYKIILDRMVGNHRLHDQVIIMCAGNHETDNAVAHSMSTALQSRLIHLNLKVSKPDWINWAIKNNIDSRIIGFIEFQPDMLHKFKPDHDDHTYPAPRTWEFVHRLVKKTTISMEDMPILAGTVGRGAATEFISYVEVYAQLPTIASIIADPENASIPFEPSLKYAMSTFLADNINDKNYVELLKYLRRLPVEGRVVCLRMIQGRQPSLMRKQEMIDIFQSVMALM